LLAGVAVVAMHGVSAHASVGHHATDGHAELHGHDAASDAPDGRGTTTDPCDECASAAAASCALITGGTIVDQPQPSTSIRRRDPQAPEPPSCSWSPDPPVPKVVLIER
jgi:hypothetical protein